MFIGKKNFYFLTLWAILTITFAEEGSGQNDPNSVTQDGEGGPNNEKASMFDQIPFFGPMASQFASSFPNFLGQGLGGGFGQNGLGFGSQNGAAGLGQLPSFNPFSSQDSSSFSNPFAQGFSGLGSELNDGRQSEADAPVEETEDSQENENHGRLFFSSLFNTRLVTCNYTTQAGRTCSSCRQALTCFPSNVGALRTCRGFFPYCNNGRCSIFQGAQCNSAATTTVATTSATESTTTTV